MRNKKLIMAIMENQNLGKLAVCASVSLQFGNSPPQLQQPMQMGIRPMSLNNNGMMQHPSMQQQPVLREEAAVAATQTLDLEEISKMEQEVEKDKAKIDDGK